MDNWNKAKLIIVVIIIVLILLGACWFSFIELPKMIKPYSQYKTEQDAYCSKLTDTNATWERQGDGWGNFKEYCITPTQTIEIKFGKILAK